MPGKASDIGANQLGIFNTKGNQWRSLRHSANPAFSLKNAKNFAANIDGCIKVGLTQRKLLF